MPKHKKQRAKQAVLRRQSYVIEVVEGLEDIVQKELGEKIPSAKVVFVSSGELTITYDGPPLKLELLRTVLSIYEALDFPVPRPKALLGHEHFTRLIDAIRRSVGRWRVRPQNWHLAAAGSQTSVMQRVIEAVSEALQLPHDDSEGDLMLRVRPNKISDQPIWQVLIRLTPRPLATRPWRVANMPGALNASVAAAMQYLVKARADDRLLNIACGSGTILIERLLTQPAEVALGVDIDRDALDSALSNIVEAGVHIDGLIQADACDLPFPGASFTSVMADLPFGQLVGNHKDNLALYPAVLDEVARITESGANFVIVTHEVKLMEQCLSTNQWWRRKQEIKINLTGIHPRIYVLQRA
ncbi:MAG: methyltransferase domain-containing protein [Anaerolineae bacterium]|nr:methyltransferase domain-containing protein [Anaerolineae bacterium]